MQIISPSFFPDVYFQSHDTSEEWFTYFNLNIVWIPNQNVIFNRIHWNFSRINVFINFIETLRGYGNETGRLILFPSLTEYVDGAPLIIKFPQR